MWTIKQTIISQRLLWWGNGISLLVLEIGRCQNHFFEWKAWKTKRMIDQHERTVGLGLARSLFYNFAFSPFRVEIFVFPLLCDKTWDSKLMRQCFLTRHQLGTRFIHDVIGIRHTALRLDKNAAFLVRSTLTRFCEPLFIPFVPHQVSILYRLMNCSVSNSSRADD